MVYWLAITYALLMVGISGLLVPFFELEIMVPLVVGLSGVFIALWLANRERNKTISENHFYKVHLLWYVWRMLDTVASFYTHLEIIELDAQQNQLDVPKDEAVGRAKEASLAEYRYLKSQIEMLNVNTFVPADVRSSVSLLVRDGGIPVSQYLNNVELNARSMEAHLLRPLDKLMKLKYLSKDSNEDVKKWRDRVNALRYNIGKDVGGGKVPYEPS